MNKKYVVQLNASGRQELTDGIKSIIDEVYPLANRVILVCDNLNTYKLSLLNKVFGDTDPRKSDMWDGRKIERKRRVSLTFRNVILE